MSSNVSCIVFQLPRYHESIVVVEEKKVSTLHNIACSFHVEFHTRERRSGEGSTQGKGGRRRLHLGGVGKAPPSCSTTYNGTFFTFHINVRIYLCHVYQRRTRAPIFFSGGISIINEREICEIHTFELLMKE